MGRLQETRPATGRQRVLPNMSTPSPDRPDRSWQVASCRLFHNITLYHYTTSLWAPYYYRLWDDGNLHRCLCGGVQCRCRKESARLNTLVFYCIKTWHGGIIQNSGAPRQASMGGYAMYSVRLANASSLFTCFLLSSFIPDAIMDITTM